MMENPLWDDDKLHEECGVFGVYGAEPHAASLVALGLHALQHRGKEAAGIVSFDPIQNSFFNEKRLGLVRDQFSEDEAVIERLPGPTAIGHNRYSTSGKKGLTALRDVQPIFAEFSPGGCAIAHNGNITNAESLRKDLVQRGSIFQSSSDTECIAHLMARSPVSSRGIPERLQDALRSIEGAFSIVAMTRTKMIGRREIRARH